MAEDIPETGAVFTFGKSHFADNEPSHFFIKHDPVVAVSCGDEHSAVICQNGRVFVFGANAWGQLGLGHTDEVTRPSCVKLLKPHRATFVACGRAHTIFVTDSNEVYSAGCNAEGQLGVGDTQPRSAPQRVPLAGARVVQVSAGSDHSALLTEEGRVWVCGSNAEGQLGLGEGARSAARFAPLRFAERVASVECGSHHTLFITEQGAVFVTGDNENQKLGVPDMTTIYVPQALPLDVPIKSACCGADHSFLLSMDETKILAFGSNEKGQLGVGRDVAHVAQPTELRLEQLFDGYQLKLLACGAAHTAFVTDNGLLYTCGESRHDKLCLEAIDDNSNEPNQYVPKRVTAMLGFVVDNVACGGYHTLLSATRASDASCSAAPQRSVAAAQLPPLQKLPAMPGPDRVNGNLEDAASITSLEANVSGSHIVNINDLEIDNDSKGSLSETPNMMKDEIDTMGENVDYAMKSAGDHVADSMKSVEDSADKLMGSAETCVGKFIDDVDKNVDKGLENAETVLLNGKNEIDNMAKDSEESIDNVTKDLTETIHTRTEAVEDIFKKTIVDKAPGLHSDERKVLEVPDKISETVNSPPPKTPIIQGLLDIPDISQTSPNLSRKSDDGQKSETGQSENETIPCGSDKSSPPDKIAKTQAVMPIVRSEEHIAAHGAHDAHDAPAAGCEDAGDVVVPTSRFARMFQVIKDKENSCMGRGKVIEENVVDNVHKGVDTAEESVRRVETAVTNQTSSRTCAIL